ncbi:MAG: GDP-mannose 4,6-dehydratase [Thermoleophilia bacterium]|nr:GDP-mannose 4,6-dehydratase [Thermoleophilia bacterium]
MKGAPTPSIPGAVLVTGAAGFVGRYVVDALRDRYPAAMLALLDHPSSRICGTAGTLEMGDSTARIAVDITCADDLRPALEQLTARVGAPDLVVHLAARAAVGESYRSPAETYRVNVVGTALVLEALTDIAPHARVLIPSSAQVYAPATSSEPLSESSPIGPSSHYGASKLAQEEVARVFLRTAGLPVFITRAFNHIGPGQQLGFVLPDFARQIVMIERAAALGQPAQTLRVGNLEARRDYSDVRDVVDGYLAVLERGEPGVCYNIASGQAWSARQLLDMLLSEAELPIHTEEDPHLMRPCDVPVMIGDAARLRGLGWQPSRDIRQTVTETLAYWRRRND